MGFTLDTLSDDEARLELSRLMDDFRVSGCYLADADARAVNRRRYSALAMALKAVQKGGRDDRA